MGFRVRKSIKIAPGVRLNVSKSGVGASVGGKGLRYSVHSSGRKTVSAGIPGTGIGYSRSLSGRSSSRQPSTSARQAPSPPKPGWFSPKPEKELYKAINAQDPNAMARVAQSYTDYATLAFAIAGLMKMSRGETREAISLLEGSFGSGQNPEDHPFAVKYVHSTLNLSLAPGVAVTLPINRDAVGLALGELYQQEGNLDASIATIEQLEPTSHAAVSLCELYVHAEKYQQVIDLTNGMKNEDDSTALLCVYRGVALRELRYFDAAREALKEALKSKARDPQIRHLGLSERAYVYQAEGKKAQAKKDLERILAEDAEYESIQMRLMELSS